MLETTNARSGPYVASGSGTEYPFHFPVLSPLHLAVYKDGERQGVDQYGTTLTTNGGSVIFHTPPAAGSLVAIIRDVPIVQDVDLQNNTAFLPEVIEMAMDRLTMICQQMQEILSRTLTAPPTEDLDQAQLFEQFLGIPDEAAAASSSAAAAASSAEAAEEDKGTVLAYKTEAFQYYQNCLAFYNLADAAALAATTAKTAAEQAKQVAQGASTNAYQSAITAAQCETGALSSKNAAAISAYNADQSAIAAAQHESGALASKEAAAISEQNAANVSGITEHNADDTAHASLRQKVLYSPWYPPSYTETLDAFPVELTEDQVNQVRTIVQIRCLAAETNWAAGSITDQVYTVYYSSTSDLPPEVGACLVPVKAFAVYALSGGMFSLYVGCSLGESIHTTGTFATPLYTINRVTGLIQALDKSNWEMRTVTTYFN